MKPDLDHHLDEEQLIRAVVDAADLPESMRDHLTGCRQCLNGISSFERELKQLGRKADRFVPEPQRRIMLPAATDKNFIRNLLDWPKLTAAAAAVCAVFILVWGTNTVRNLAGQGTGNAASTMLEAERLMTEVNTLVDNALPPFYLEISGERKSGDTEDFYRFLIPSVEDKAVTSDRWKKGNSLC